MTVQFDPAEDVILVSATIQGPVRSTVILLVLDTGATLTVLTPRILEFVGYVAEDQPARIRITTGSGTEYGTRVIVRRIECLGMERIEMPIVCYDFPPSAGIQGVLGLDFLREHKLVIDMREGTLCLD